MLCFVINKTEKHILVNWVHDICPVNLECNGIVEGSFVDTTKNSQAIALFLLARLNSLVRLFFLDIMCNCNLKGIFLDILLTANASL